MLLLYPLKEGHNLATCTAPIDSELAIAEPICAFILYIPKNCIIISGVLRQNAERRFFHCLWGQSPLKSPYEDHDLAACTSLIDTACSIAEVLRDSFLGFPEDCL